jgi:hypothetical protein
MRFIYVVVGMAVLFIAPVVLKGASAAFADTGINNYAHCVSAAGLPPRQQPEDWLPTAQIIQTHLHAESAAQTVQVLVASGVKPSDAVAEVQCAQAVGSVG